MADTTDRFFPGYNGDDQATHDRSSFKADGRINGLVLLDASSRDKRDGQTAWKLIFLQGWIMERIDFVNGIPVVVLCMW